MFEIYKKKRKIKLIVQRKVTHIYIFDSVKYKQQKCVRFIFLFTFSLCFLLQNSIHEIKKDVVRYAEDSPRYFSAGIFCVLLDSKVSRVMQSVIFGKIGNILVKEECNASYED